MRQAYLWFVLMGYAHLIIQLKLIFLIAKIYNNMKTKFTKTLFFIFLIYSCITNAQDVAFLSFGGVSVYDYDADINVDYYPTSNALYMATTPDGVHLYVVENGNSTISVWEIATGTKVATISMGAWPSPQVVDIKISPNGQFAYVSERWTGDVAVIQTSDNTVIDNVNTGSYAFGIDITPNGDYVYVANEYDHTVSVIATATNTVVSTISSPDLSTPTNVAITPDGAYAYVTNFGGGVSVIETSSNTVVTTVTAGTSPFGVAVTLDGNFVYVSNYFSNDVTVIQTSDNSVIATVPTTSGGTWLRDVAISPDGLHAYVAVQTTFKTEVISIATNTVVKTVPGGYGIAFGSLQPPITDTDGDGIADNDDDCPSTPSGEGVNANGCSCSQVTVDDGDVCTLDECADGLVTNTFQDADNDTVCDANDVCPGGDDTTDTDSDGTPDFCDACPNDADNDIDDDGVCGDVDNCPNDYNPNQEDNDIADGDDGGDACDDDDDNDGILDNCDTAPFVDNFVYNGVGPDFPQQWLCGNNNNKVKVCHVPSGNPSNAHTICVSKNAVSAHIGNHEDDYLGECTCTNQMLVSNANSSFEARAIGPKVNLYWAVPDNQGIDHFVLEHSTDREDFELLAERNTDIGLNWELYELIDNWPSEGINYYRLTIHRKNGEVEVMPIREIHFTMPPAYGLVPNPASEETYFNIKLRRGQSVTITMFNSIGQQVYQKDIGKVEKAFERIDLTDFEDGLYIVSLKVGNDVYSSKLVVKK